MSFTADELQSFNDILEKKLAEHRREMERAFEQRLHALRREMEQHLITIQQEIVRTLTQKLAEQQKGFSTTLSQRLNTQQTTLTQALSQELKQRQQQQQPQLEGLIERTLAAQLLAIEELLNQRLTVQPLVEAMPEALSQGYRSMSEQPPQFEAIEVQTELPWEDLMDIFGKVLDERFVTLSETTQATMKSWEQYFSALLHTLQAEIHDEVLQARQPQASPSNLTNMQEVFQSIEQLERLIESMQVAMTANHALLSNRLYHHQQLPLERAHVSSHKPSTPASHSNTSHPDGMNSTDSASLTEEHGESTI